jgi:uncharacterized protein YlxW (UPF0749 family)
MTNSNNDYNLIVGDILPGNVLSVQGITDLNSFNRYSTSIVLNNLGEVVTHKVQLPSSIAKYTIVLNKNGVAKQLPFLPDNFVYLKDGRVAYYGPSTTAQIVLPIIDGYRYNDNCQLEERDDLSKTSIYSPSNSSAPNQGNNQVQNIQPLTNHNKTISTSSNNSLTNIILVGFGCVALLFGFNACNNLNNSISSNTEKVTQNEKKVSLNSEETKLLRNKVDELEKSKDEIKDLKQEIKDLNTKISEVKSENDTQKAIEIAKKQLEVEKTLNKKQKEVIKEDKEVQKLIKLVTDSTDSKESKTLVKEAQSVSEEVQNQFKSIKKSLDNVDSQIQDLKNKYTQLTTDLEKYSKQLNEVKKSFEEIQKQVDEKLEGFDKNVKEINDFLFPKEEEKSKKQ